MHHCAFIHHGSVGGSCETVKKRHLVSLVHFEAHSAALATGPSNKNLLSPPSHAAWSQQNLSVLNTE